MLKGSFIPDRSSHKLQDLTSYKKKIINQIAAEKEKKAAMEKLLSETL
jgi:hypothetical protein